MKPSTNKEECTIDLTADKIPFSCIVDGNESINKWQIKIYDITNNEEILSTKEIPLEPPFYPIDEKNRNVVFSVDLKEYLGDDATFVNRAEAYYWTITLWGSSGYSTTSYQEVFYANKTPNIGVSYEYQTGESPIVLSENKENNILISRECTFKGVLDFGDNEQEYKAQLKRYGWRITDTDSGQVFVDTITKNQIYGSADNIICKYDGFLNGGNYSVELFIETQNNAKATSSFEFSVSYASTFLSNDFKVEALKNEPAIMLDWNKALVIAGILKDAQDNIVSINDTAFKTNYPVDDQCSIDIPIEYKVIYNNDVSLNFDISEDSDIMLSTQLLSRNETELFLAEGYDDAGYEVIRKLTYNDGIFRYDIVGKNGVVMSAEHSVTNKPSEYVWYNIIMSPLIEMDDGKYTVELEVYESNVVNCIYPSENLYPMAETAWAEAGSEYFYPIFGNWNNLKPASGNTETEG